MNVEKVKASPMQFATNGKNSASISKMFPDMKYKGKVTKQSKDK